CISFMRKSGVEEETVYIVCNFADETREGYRIGLPNGGEYVEIFNSQDAAYEGWNIGNDSVLHAEQKTMHGRDYSLRLTLPPLGVVYLKRLTAAK
ncbi:MAG TPA: 1,4-alpha-glucan branching enzyme, partial [Sulfuricurvum sp.]|nr:1,4-alpha-glucan branching enzyme [Sulfuricurvum sp.]